MMLGVEYRRRESRERRQGTRILAQEFARERVWLRSPTPFSLEQLHRRSNKIRAGEDTAFNSEAQFYREVKSRRPAGIAIHYRDWPEIGPELEAICARFGLRYEAVVNF